MRSSPGYCRLAQTIWRNCRRARRSQDGDGIRHRRARRGTPVDDRRCRFGHHLLSRFFRDPRSIGRVRAEKIYLVGFMGAGKTTVARVLAKRLGWETVDVDEAIERRERLPVSEIFATRGEPYFRVVERAVLFEQIGRPHMVVATGGGTF